MAAIEWWWNEHVRAVLMCMAGRCNRAFCMQQHCSPYSRDEGIGVEMIGSQNGNENVQLI